MKCRKKQSTLSSRLLTLAVAMLAFPLIGGAAITPAGTDVTNTVSVAYSVDGVIQDPASDSVTFEVDVMINPVVSVSGVDVAPGETSATLVYTLTNSGNDVQDFSISFAERTDDTTNLTAISVYLDNDNSSTLTAGDVQISASDSTAATEFVDNLVPEGQVKIIVVGNIPLTLADTNTLRVDLMATARDGSVAGGAAGAIELETATPALLVVDTVFADALGPYGDGTIDTDEDGKHSATGTFTVATVTVTVTKTAAVIDNGLDTASTDAFFIPGATVEYTITVSYTGAAGATATAVTVSDPLPAETTFASGTLTLNTVAQADPANLALVSLAIGDRAGDATDDVVTFRVTID